MARKKGHGGGGHGGAWVITFADLMALLMAFFVMLVASANQDKQKLADAAGSLREAFGVQPEFRRAGMIERDGLPVRQFLKESNVVEKKLDASHSAERNDRFEKQGPEANTHNFERAAEEKPKQFLTAAASLRQALADMPEIAEISKNVIFEETDEGLNIRLVDQDGRSMFAEGSRTPYEHTRQILMRIAPVIARMPHRIRVTGHTAGGRRWSGTSGSPWELSAGRAATVQEVLASFGVGYDRFESVVGKADAEPLFPTEPFLAANRRVDILLAHQAPPLPNSPLK
ncbi:OmpA/MotB family protein [Prosthecodimorpha staleyi]|uniref:Flagellar motor protein MotB n=1 Tax=Prosthecodimorpha staleyi TaxID=2840188 RepID=A0A947D8J9_9HYPH|nr:flagellar motor protein MotB [Prosthecodimorpha staleyi]MBT9291491.1 flagellar motor protein MotB [Prosthecodimorpha staleyi]